MIGCQVALYFAENSERTVKLISNRKREVRVQVEYGNQVALLDLIERTTNIEIHDQTELQRITEKGVFIKPRRQ
jgi:hypothetical protein